MGEIGISRREFLYDIKFWEVRRIIRGYRKRGRIYMQLLAENAFASTFAFIGNKDHITPRDMFPNLFDDEDDDIEPKKKQRNCKPRWKPSTPQVPQSPLSHQRFNHNKAASPNARCFFVLCQALQCAVTSASQIPHTHPLPAPSHTFASA